MMSNLAGSITPARLVSVVFALTFIEEAGGGFVITWCDSIPAYHKHFLFMKEYCLCF